MSNISSVYIPDNNIGGNNIEGMLLGSMMGGGMGYGMSGNRMPNVGGAIPPIVDPMYM